MAYHGYTGGDAETELIKAFNQISADAEVDTVNALRAKFFVLGEILEIAIARSYTKKLGVRGWCVTTIGCSYTHAQNCRNAFKRRHDFEEAYAWYKNSNTDFRPSKASGPLFAIELVKAWKVKDEPGETKPKAKAKDRAKDAVIEAAKWRTRYQRLKDDYLKISSNMEGWESIVLNAIEFEIAQDEGTTLPISIQPGLPPDEAQASEPPGDRDDVSANHRPETVETIPANDPPEKERKPRRRSDLPPIETTRPAEDGSDMIVNRMPTLSNLAGEANHAD